MDRSRSAGTGWKVMWPSRCHRLSRAKGASLRIGPRRIRRRPENSAQRRRPDAWPDRFDRATRPLASIAVRALGSSLSTCPVLQIEPSRGTSAC